MKIAVAVPCYKVRDHVLDVLRSIPDCVHVIYAVDDACPDSSGKWIEERNTDPRVKVLYNPQNLGVGGAVITAYRQALADGADVVVKIDGDGQMNPRLLPMFIRPIVEGRADYTKGNRFFRLESLKDMPKMRLFGNAALSFITKVSSGYWNIMDPTNGYTAIHAALIRELPLDKVATRYFFETDMLFRLNTIRAVVRDIPMDAVYGDEESNLRIGRVLPEFAGKHLSRLWRRYGYNYWLRDFNIGSIYSALGALLFAGGASFGLMHWIESIQTGQGAPSGTVMAAALPVLIGFQLLLAFLHYDMSRVPVEPIHGQLACGAVEDGA